MLKGILFWFIIIKFENFFIKISIYLWYITGINIFLFWLLKNMVKKFNDLGYLEIYSLALKDPFFVSEIIWCLI